MRAREAQPVTTEITNIENNSRKIFSLMIPRIEFVLTYTSDSFVEGYREKVLKSRK